MSRPAIPATVVVLAMCGCAGQSQVSAQRTATSDQPATSAPGTPLATALPSSTRTNAPASATSSRPSTSESAGTIPWLDLPGAHHDPTPLPTRSPTDVAPACRAAQLAVASVGPPGDTADDGAIVDLRNVSKENCLLTGAVRATLFGPQAPPVDIIGNGTPTHWQSHDMAPGGTTSVWFTANGVCMSGPARGLEAIPVTKARLQIPGGGSVPVTGLHMPRTCGGPLVGGFYQHPADPTYPPAPLDGAQITILTPATVQARSTLDYTVEISNPTANAITMQPCPSFQQFLSPFPVKTYQRLNCGAHTDLQAHEILRFAMKLAVPPEETNGPEKLFWELDTLLGGHPPVIVTVVASHVTPSTPPSAAPSS